MTMVAPAPKAVFPVTTTARWLVPGFGERNMATDKPDWRQTAGGYRSGVVIIFSTRAQTLLPSVFIIVFALMNFKTGLNGYPRPDGLPLHDQSSQDAVSPRAGAQHPSLRRPRELTNSIGKYSGDGDDCAILLQLDRQSSRCFSDRVPYKVMNRFTYSLLRPSKSRKRCIIHHIVAEALDSIEGSEGDESQSRASGICGSVSRCDYPTGLDPYHQARLRSMRDKAMEVFALKALMDRPAGWAWGSFTFVVLLPRSEGLVPELALGHHTGGENRRLRSTSGRSSHAPFRDQLPADVYLRTTTSISTRKSTKSMTSRSLTRVMVGARDRARLSWP